jgi:hypothetical protein
VFAISARLQVYKWFRQAPDFASLAEVAIVRGEGCAFLPSFREPGAPFAIGFARGRVLSIFRRLDFLREELMTSISEASLIPPASGMSAKLQNEASAWRQRRSARPKFSMDGVQVVRIPKRPGTIAKGGGESSNRH